MMTEAIEQWSAQAKHQRHGMSRLVMAAGLIVLNVGQWDMKLSRLQWISGKIQRNLETDVEEVMPRATTSVASFHQSPLVRL